MKACLHPYLTKVRPALQWRGGPGIILLSVLGAGLAWAEPQSIHPADVTASGRYQDDPYELGTIFRPLVPGKITAVRVFSLLEEEGAAHTVRIWRNADNTVIAGPIEWTYGGEEDWITLPITPVAVGAGVDYTVAISVGPGAWYPANAGHFEAAGDNGAQLAYPAAAGVFIEGEANVGRRPTSSFNNASYLRDIVFEPDALFPIIEVSGNAVVIAYGDATPSLADHTQFGGSAVGAGLERTFTLRNAGLAPLVLAGDPVVTLTGPQAADFQVTSPPASPVAPGASTTFTIRFLPSAKGSRTATVGLRNDAADTFAFSIQGVGTEWGNTLLGNTESWSVPTPLPAGQLTGSKFLALRNMRLNSLRAKFLEPLSGLAKAAVYSDVNGAPGVMLAETVELEGLEAGWRSLPLTSPFDIQAGSSYWLLLLTDGGALLAEGKQPGAWARTFSGAYGEWPDQPEMQDSVPPDRTLVLYATGIPFGVTTAEIDVTGLDDLPVMHGATSAANDNGTDLGTVILPGAPTARTFTIRNVGAAPLALTGGSPVTVAGPDASSFSITTQPTSPLAAVTGAATFEVQFNPTTPGLKTALVSIAHDAPFGQPYTFTVQGLAVASQAQSIFSGAAGGNDSGPEGTFYELGTVFSPVVDGTVTHLRVYALATEAGTHIARLWRNSDETVIAGPYEWVYGGAAGWITLDIPNVPVEAGEYYTISISTGDAPHHYPFLAQLFPEDRDNGFDLLLPFNAGVFSTASGTRPANSFNAAGYFRDVIFVPGAVVEEPVAPVVTGVTYQAGTNQVTLTWVSQPGASYIVERSQTLASGQWDDLPGSVASGGTETTFTDTTIPANTPRLFYRIRVAE